jgi:formate hydrogenlyase transcriptional activator
MGSIIEEESCEFSRCLKGKSSAENGLASLAERVNVANQPGQDSVDVTVEFALQRVRRVLQADTANLLLLSADQEYFDLVVSGGREDKKLECTRIPVSSCIGGRIAASGGSWSVQDPDGIQEFSPALKSSIRSVAGAALHIRDLVVGIICVGTTEKRAWSKQDLVLLEMAADRVSSALEAASARQRYESFQKQLEQEHARLQLLLDINNSLVCKLNIQELFAAVSESLRRLTRHNYSQIVLFDQKCARLKVAALDFPKGKGLIHEGLIVPCHGSPAGVVYTSRNPLLITHLDKAEFPSDTTDRLLGEGVRSICLAPLIRRGRALGVLSIGSAHLEAFSAGDLALMTQVADQVAIAIDNALAFEKIEELNQRLEKEKQYLEEELRAEGVLNELVGTSRPLNAALKQVHTVAGTNATVLVVGETGTGKELLARAVHQLSQRRHGPFVKLNCAAIPATLLESELFGHAKGAFTGAINRQIGRLELADGGTLFLDEIGELPLELQPKLLRVLQDRQFERLGESKTVNVNVRLVAATNRNLEAMVHRGEFRSDLYYRLNVFPIQVPALRERKEDIPALVHYFVDKFAREMQKTGLQIPNVVMNQLVQWHWPGNVRELENLIERAVILSSGLVLELPPINGFCAAPDNASDAGTLDQMQREYILSTLRESGGLVGTPVGAAARLGLKRTTLYAKMRKLGISRSDIFSENGITSHIF